MEHVVYGPIRRVHVARQLYAVFFQLIVAKADRALLSDVRVLLLESLVRQRNQAANKAVPLGYQVVFPHVVVEHLQPVAGLPKHQANEHWDPRAHQQGH